MSLPHIKYFSTNTHRVFSYHLSARVTSRQGSIAWRTGRRRQIDVGAMGCIGSRAAVASGSDSASTWAGTDLRRHGVASEPAAIPGTGHVEGASEQELKERATASRGKSWSSCSEASSADTATWQSPRLTFTSPASRRAELSGTHHDLLHDYAARMDGQEIEEVKPRIALGPHRSMARNDFHSVPPVSQADLWDFFGAPRGTHTHCLRARPGSEQDNEPPGRRSWVLPHAIRLCPRQI